MSNNHNEEDVKKRCPFNNEWCGEWCARFVVVYRGTPGGIREKAGMCVDIASNLMLSDINQKTMPPKVQMPKIQLPGTPFNRG